MDNLKLEVTSLQNDIWQVESDNTVWFQGDRTECEEFKAVALRDWYESIAGVSDGRTLKVFLKDNE